MVEIDRSQHVAAKTRRPHVKDSLKSLEELGFTGQFIVRPNQILVCAACRSEMTPEDILLKDLRRVDFETDPGQQSLIAGLICPTCDVRGTYAFTYGPQADANEAEILRKLRDSSMRKRRR